MAIESNEIKRVFLAALEVTDSKQRCQLLDVECGADPELRRRVDILLRAHDDPASVVEHPIGGSLAETKPVTDSLRQIGQILAGKYKLLEPIGEGGMGSVWIAEQFEPVKRKVAIKLVKPGMDSRQVLARFEAERQALALMDHPHIARIFDGGLTDQGRPYFVMELVKGLPVTEYCDQLRVSLAERLELFVLICQAVQHAHQKGIIHRDLKPSNVLVCMYDGKPVPKVIDFGLAKALHNSLTDETLHTGFGIMIGTPLYMSPEQAEHNNLDVDSRTDIYSLGVLLYELLTGSTPLERAQLKDAAFNEILRLIKEVEPKKPSTRLSGNARLPNIAAQRSIEPSRLGRALAGDLDWIAMKALDKERGRRYETAESMARDINRYLHDEAVEARPPSWVYQTQKFIRRHRGAVLAASLVSLAVVAGFIGTTIGLIRTEQQRSIAEASAELERLANEQAQTRLEQLVNANGLVTAIFADLDIQQVRESAEPIEAVLAQRLLKLAEQLDDNVVGDPLMVADLKVRLGESLYGLGFSRESIPLFETARDVQRKHLGEDHPLTLASMGNLANSLSGAGEVDLALPLLEQTLERRKEKLGSDDPDTLMSMNNLAMTLIDQGRREPGILLMEETLELRKRHLGSDHRDTLISMNNLAVAYQKDGRLTQALSLFEEVLKLRKLTGDNDHPATLSSMNNLANMYFSLGKLDLAVPLSEETLRMRRSRLGAYHRDTVKSMNSLASGFMAVGRFDEAIQLFDEGLRTNQVVLGSDHPDTLVCMGNLAAAYNATGRFEQSLPLFEKTWQLRSAKQGPDHPDTIYSLSNLASAYRMAGQLDRALPLLEESLRLRQAKLGPDHPETLLSQSNLAYGHQVAGDLELALPLFQEAAAGMERLKFESELAARLVDNLCICHEQMQQYDQAELWRRKWLAVEAERTGTDSAPFAGALAALGANLLFQEKWNDAESVLRDSFAIRNRMQPEDWRTFNTQSLLGQSLTGQALYAEAEPLLLEGYTGLKQRESSIPPAARTRIKESLQRLVDLYVAWEKPDQAAEWQRVLELLVN
jgi:serine/threonine protein kinase